MIKKSRSRTRSKRGGQSYVPNQSYEPNQESNWLDNSWNKIKSSTNNLYNSISGPNQTPYDPNQIQYDPNQSSEQNQEKPWYKFWGGRRRTKSRKNRRTCKKRSRK